MTEIKNSPQLPGNSQRKAKFRELYGTSTAIAEDVYRLPPSTTTDEERRIIEHNRRILAAKVGRELIGREKIHGTEIEQARETSMIDALTGVKSRRWFDENIEERIANTTRTGQPLYMIIIDLDKFKDINDAYGHETGDNILKLMGKLEARTDEPLARYGGDEFVQLIDREFSEVDLISMINRYRDQIKTESAAILKNASLLPESEIENPSRIATLSFGITRFIPGESAEHFRMRTDAALYHVKNNGRDSAAIAVADHIGTGISFKNLTGRRQKNGRMSNLVSNIKKRFAHAA